MKHPCCTNLSPAADAQRYTPEKVQVRKMTPTYDWLDLEFTGSVPRSPSSPESTNGVGSTPEASHSAFNQVRYDFPGGELISVKVKVYSWASASTVNV